MISLFLKFLQSTLTGNSCIFQQSNSMISHIDMKNDSSSILSENLIKIFDGILVEFHFEMGVSLQAT